jgi:hypothetical protein
VTKPRIEAGRWDWFAGDQNRMLMGGLTGKPAKVGTLAEYQSWMTTRPPPDAIVGAQQLPGAVPVAVDWVLVDEDGQDSWGAVDPSSGIGPSLYWGTTADTPVGAGLSGAVAAYLGGVYVEWSVAGHNYWQMCDATPRGTLVIGVADWVRVSYIGCEQTVGEGGPDCFVWYDETGGRCRALLRPAEMGERSNARVSHGAVACPSTGPSSVVAMWMGQKAKRVSFFAQVLTAATVAGVSVFSLLGWRLASFVWPSNNNAGSNILGRPPNEQASVLLPGGAWSMQARLNGATAGSICWAAEID